MRSSLLRNTGAQKIAKHSLSYCGLRKNVFPNNLHGRINRHDRWRAKPNKDSAATKKKNDENRTRKKGGT